jgi:hypothetical protein
MDKNKLKEVLKTIVTEESEYQVFFKKALEKAGKSITDMSDDEKKAFFNKIDAAWDGKGEKNEELTGNQHKLDIDGDGEIEASDLSALRAGEKKEESVNEVNLNKHVWEGWTVGAFIEELEPMFDMVMRGRSHQRPFKDKMELKRWLMDNQPYYKKHIPDVYKYFEKKYNELSKNESVNEEKYTVIDPRGNSLGTADKTQVAMAAKKKGGEKAGYFVVSAKNALKARRALEKFKGDFKNPKLKDMMAGLYESVNEEIAVGKMVKVVDNPHWEAALGKKGPFKRKVKGIYGDSVFFTDGSNSSMKYVKESVESVNENEVPGRVPSQIKVKLDKAVDQIKSSNLTYPQRLKVLSHVMDGLGIDKKELTKITTKLKGTLESTVNEDDLDVGHIDDEPNMLKSTALEIAQYGAKLVEKLDQYDNMSQEVDFPNWWQAKLILAKDYVHGAYHYLDSKETLGEGRAFINAARKAKTEGKTEFEFNGKTYPVTIKD